MKVVVLVAVACIVFGACNDMKTITIASAEQRDALAQEGWVPSTLSPGATLTRDDVKRSCTIKTSTMPVGTVDHGMLLVGGHRWLIVSTEPVVLQCVSR